MTDAQVRRNIRRAQRANPLGGWSAPGPVRRGVVDLRIHPAGWIQGGAFWVTPYGDPEGAAVRVPFRRPGRVYPGPQIFQPTTGW